MGVNVSHIFPSAPSPYDSIWEAGRGLARVGFGLQEERVEPCRVAEHNGRQVVVDAVGNRLAWRRDASMQLDTICERDDNHVGGRRALMRFVHCGNLVLMV